jgi:hypothetical protein
MSLSRNRTILVGALMLSACNAQQTANQSSANSAVAADLAIEDADTRAARLAEQSLLLNEQAARATGARRQALQNEASADLSDAVSVERQGEDDAGNIADAADSKIQVSDRR